MGRLTKNYIYNFSYQLLVAITPLFTAPYLVRKLGAVNLGIHAYTFSIVSFMSLFTFDISFFGSRQIAYARDSIDRLNETFSEVFTDAIVLAIFASIVYFIICFVNKDFTIYLLIYYIYFLSNVLDISWLFVGVEDIGIFIRRNYVLKLLTIFGIFIFVKSRNDLVKYILIESISMLVATLLIIPNVKKYITSFRLSFNNLFANIIAAMWLFLPTFAQKIYIITDNLMIKAYIYDISEISFYDYANKIIAIPLVLITALTAVVMPRVANEFANNNKDEINNILCISTRFSLFFAIPMSFGIAVTASKLIPWYLGHDYLPVISGLIIMSPITIANILRGVSGHQYLTAIKKTGVIFVIECISILANIIINSLLIPYMGYIGAAISTVLTSFFAAIIQMSVLFKDVKILGFYRFTAKYIIESIIFTIVVFLLTNNMIATIRVTIAQIVIGLLVYLLLNFITHDRILFIIIDKIKNVIVKIIK